MAPRSACATLFAGNVFSRQSQSSHFETAGVESRTSIQPGDMRHMSLEVASRGFLNEGIAASTKSIAREAGVSEEVIFQSFTTKEELFFAAIAPPAAGVNRILRHSGTENYQQIEKLTFAMLECSRIIPPILTPLTTHPSFRFEEFANTQSPVSVIHAPARVD